MINRRIAVLGGLCVGVLLSFASVSAAQGRRNLPGDLTKAIDQYTGDEFFALVNGLNYTGGQTRGRRCSGDPACGGAQRTNVQVDAVTTEDSLSAGTLPQFGVVAMRAVVRGQQTEAMYGMLPNGPDGRYSYYLIVMPGPNGTATWRLEQLNVQGQTRTHSALRTGRFTPCNHAFVPGARADFKTCAEAAGAPAAAAAAGRAHAASPQKTSVFRYASFTMTPSRQGSEPPIWIGCASGCCTADQ